MTNNILGIHHVTAIAGDPQKNVDFYVGVLGMRLVKKTINFDDPHTYHLYFGDEGGNPGSLLTFFPWSAHGRRGRRGVGQIAAYSLSISDNAMSYWIDRMKKLKIDFSGPTRRFDEEVLTLRDQDGFIVELITSSNDHRQQWGNENVEPAFAIRGIHSVTLSEEGSEQTAEFLTSSLSFRPMEDSGNRSRFAVSSGEPGMVVDIVSEPHSSPGTMGVGVIHHVAWRTPNAHTQLAVRDVLMNAGIQATPVINRCYFDSIYFHEPGSILFEVATDPPGFMIDETKEQLGTNLKLPPWLERNRAEIEKVLPPISIPK